MRWCTYLLAYLQFTRAYKTGNISETVEDRAKATRPINGLYKVVHWLSIFAKMYDLERLEMTSERDLRSLIP